ncbi:MAG: AAA family ATPase [Nitrospinota bacterium]|nr:AAA family ATPase [Nitrospinota bacterium]
MRLKSIEMKGFKSFVDKTTIDLTGPMTAVVGPNGCGKSNVSDAIRWVLGEQAPNNMRARKMDDLIFNGNAERKSHGMAEVSMTLAELNGSITDLKYKDFEEIVVTRRLYRSGESEYLINKNFCRLKDITDLFLDTGVSLDSFSIIEQGKIEELVNSKPMDRRILIEEAAGIMKYKNRRNEALRKLELSLGNLTRMDDVMREKKSRLNSLGRQASKAKYYKEYQEEIKNLDLCVSVLDFIKIKNDLKPAELDLEKLRESEQVVLSKISTHESDRERLRIDLQQKSELISNTKQRLVQVDGELIRLQGQKEIFSNRIKELVEEKLKREDESNVLKEEISSFENENNLLIEQEEKFKDLVDKTRGEDSLFKEFIKDVKENSDLSQYFDEEVEDNLKDYFSQVKEVLQTQSQLQAKVDAVEDRCSNLKNLQADNENKLSELKENLLRKRTLLQATQTTIDSSLEQRAGTNDFLKLGVHARSLFSDSLIVEKKFEKAVESILKELLFGVVVESSDEAFSAIKTLVSKGDVRAIAVPINTQKRSYPEILKSEKVFGSASSIVTCQDEFRDCINQLLGGVGIVEDIDVAYSSWLSGPSDITWVTLNGEIIYPNGSFECGSSKLDTTGILERKRKCEVLKSEIQENEKRFLESETDYDRVNIEILSAENELTDAKDNKRQLEIQLVSIEERVHSKLRVSLTEFSGRVLSIQSELSRLKESIEKSRVRKNSCSADIQEIILKTEKSQESIKSFKEQTSILELEKRKIIESEVGQDKVITSIQVENKELGNQIRELRVESDQISDQITNASETRTTLEVKKDSMTSQVLDKYGVRVDEKIDEFLDELPFYGEKVDKLQELNNRFSKLGEVNHLAAQEYDEVNEEYSFLKEQRNDLDQSILNLKETIEKLNKTTKAKFLDAFEKVQKHFEDIFRRLFSGGEAKLFMLEPDKPLESGVDIEVRPPGKRPANVMLLSSGEKALTAISLLFSVFSVKPSPFCLLDEVDATLDDANVVRFREVLCELEDRSQFIVITHNKKTMSFASQLYGITQREKGVSEIVSVQLNRRGIDQVEQSASGIIS